jgi:hypothetical protein
LDGTIDKAVQLKYSFVGTNTYIQLIKDYSVFDMGELEWPETKIRFYYRGSGPSNTLLFRLTDVDGDMLSRRFSNATNASSWTKVEIPASDFAFTPSGNGTFDFFRVKKIEVAIEKAAGGEGAGTLDIDEIEIIRTSRAGGDRVFDDFNGGPSAPNLFNGPKGSYPDSSLTASWDGSSGNAYEGAYALKMDYNFYVTAASDIGFFDGPNGANLGDYRRIEFYAKASNANDTFAVSFGSTTINQWTYVGDLGNSWKKVVIDFLNCDSVLLGSAGVSSVTELVFKCVRNVTAGSGTFWIDDIRFVRPDFTDSVVKVVDAVDEPVSP